MYAVSGMHFGFCSIISLLKNIWSILTFNLDHKVGYKN